jgi:hypothetical protein
LLTTAAAMYIGRVIFVELMRFTPQVHRAVTVM